MNAMTKTARQVEAYSDSYSLSDLNRKRLEADLNIIEWGRWMGGGWPNGDRTERPAPNITDDDALRLNKLVTKLPEHVKIVIVDMYVYRKGVMELASEFRSSNRVIMDYRDQGLNLLHGAIFLSKNL